MIMPFVVPAILLRLVVHNRTGKLYPSAEMFTQMLFVTFCKSDPGHILNTEIDCVPISSTQFLRSKYALRLKLKKNRLLLVV